MTNEEKDDLIDAWHNGAGEGQELYEFLGMTREEYSNYVKDQLIMDGMMIYLEGGPGTPREK